MAMLDSVRHRLSRRWARSAGPQPAGADAWDPQEQRRRSAEPGRTVLATSCVHDYADRDFIDGPTREVEAVVEAGGVLHFPALCFPLDADERGFLDERWTDGKSKNISLRWPGGTLRGAQGEPAQRAALSRLIERYAEHSEALVLRLFPHYRGQLRRGNTSLRPAEIAGRTLSWRKDDTRLHVDAFPSNPMRGTRLLRVFTNVNPQGRAREWRVGEPFEDFARRFLPDVPRPWPGAAALLHRLRITKSRRSEYDHYMLQLHDRAKADLHYQRHAPQLAIDFAPGSTWVTFSDQVLHAAMGGQYMMEQTFYVPPGAMKHPSTAPVAILERLLGRPLSG